VGNNINVPEMYHGTPRSCGPVARMPPSVRPEVVRNVRQHTLAPAMLYRQTTARIPRGVTMNSANSAVSWEWK
jgi:hypothetical protein